MENKIKIDNKKLLRFYNVVKSYYSDLDSLAKRLQDDYAGDKQFEQTEEDRLALCAILDLIDETSGFVEGK